MITRCLVILILLSQSYGDTTIVAFDAVHQSFGNLGNNRSITQLIQFPNSNSNYSDIMMNVSLECPDDGCDPGIEKQKYQ